MTATAARPAASPGSSTDSPEWWKHPFRIFQTNIREIDSGMDVKQVVQDILDFGCNTWLLNAGGIVSHYPSKLDHQHPSPWLKDRPSGDLLGDALEEAHRHGIRVIARCDFSKLHRDQFERHPDWFYVSKTGQRQVYEGLWSACPSGPYYQEKSLEVIAEMLDGYPVDAFFFNWFNMSLRDYSGTYHGICQCQNCKRRFAAFSGGLPLPKEESYADPSYPTWRRYTYELLDEIAGRVRHLIKSRRPDVALLLSYNPDISFHEINNAVERPLPLWRYHTGEAAKTSATAHWERPVAINAVMFWDLPYRYNAEQPGLTELVTDIVSGGDGSELYRVALPESYLGLSIDEVSARLRGEHRATLLAVSRGSHCVVNPPQDFRVQTGDDALVVAESLGKLAPLRMRPATVEEAQVASAALAPGSAG
ncbi:MAG: GH151 [uncultured Chloroflexi bacterium]|uniref:GH151 n=1 Tax=uncultured Chloroflexota bacterium TaxID=166587 RepID=A0A6J4IKN8_9CHLR|nr:MAG: GH151 [uncultured Chloroflexota bacterium]